MYKLIGINSVKRLVDEAYIPFAYGNRDYEDYKLWLAEGNVPEPEFTEEELAKQDIENQIAKAKEYLASTDYKVLPDYDGDTTGIVEARAEARTLIRSLEGRN